MNLEQAKQSVGKLVISTDPGYKMIKSLAPHGPYKLTKVTKAGLCKLEGRDDNFQISPSHLTLYSVWEQDELARLKEFDKLKAETQ